MKIDGSKIIVIGGAGFIGSQVVAELLKKNVAQVVIFDNFTRGKPEYIAESLRDARKKENSDIGMLIGSDSGSRAIDPGSGAA